MSLHPGLEIPRLERASTTHLHTSIVIVILMLLGVACSEDSSSNQSVAKATASESSKGTPASDEDQRAFRCRWRSKSIPEMHRHWLDDDSS